MAQITYALSGHDLNIAIIFTSLQFFNVSDSDSWSVVAGTSNHAFWTDHPRTFDFLPSGHGQVSRAVPLLWRVVFNTASTISLADASVALGRISSFLTAEELAEPYKIDPDNEFAIEVDGSFQWETAYKANIGGPKFDTGKGKHGHGKGAKDDKKEEKVTTKPARKGRFFKRGKKGPALPTDGKEKTDQKKKEEEPPFELADLKLRIHKGSFVAIVGRVGSGKVCHSSCTSSMCADGSLRRAPFFRHSSARCVGRRAT